MTGPTSLREMSGSGSRMDHIAITREGDLLRMQKWGDGTVFFGRRPYRHPLVQVSRSYTYGLDLHISAYRHHNSNSVRSILSAI